MVITDNEGTDHEFLISKDKSILVHDGQVVQKGEEIVEGPADPHDILRLLGIEALSRYIVDEVQDVYRLQGVAINDKHIEVIVRQMLRRVKITDPGDTKFIRDEQVERYKELFLKPQLFVPCRGGLIRVPYSNLNLPNTPDSIKQEFEVRHGLPELCFWSVEGLDRVILIQYGKSGYLPIAPPEGISAETFAEKLNSEMGVTKEQQQSMLCESPMRWDTLAKRLSRSDKRAPQHPHKQDEDKER